MKSSRKIYQKSNISSAWYMQIGSYLMLLGFGIKNALLQVPSFFYPDDPAQDGFFPYLNSEFWVQIFEVALPFFSILNVLKTWKNIKKFNADQDKTTEKYFDIGINIVTTTVSAVAMGFLICGAAAVFLYAAPYILIAVAGLSALYGLYNMSTYLYQAFCTEDWEEKKKYLWEAGKQFVATVINTLALVTTLFLGVKINAQLAQLGSNLLQDLLVLKTVGTIFKAAIPIVYALAAVVTLGFFPSVGKSALNINKETFQGAKNFIVDPKTTLKNAGKELVSQCEGLWKFIKKTKYIALPLIVVPVALEILSKTVSAVFRLAALTLAPLQLIVAGINKCFAKKEPIAVIQSDRQKNTVSKSTSSDTQCLKQFAKIKQPQPQDDVVRGYGSYQGNTLDFRKRSKMGRNNQQYLPGKALKVSRF